MNAHVLSFSLSSVPAGQELVLTYTLEVRPDAQGGDALNRAQAAGPRNNLSNIADALVRIHRETILDRMTIIGRVIDGGCRVDPRSRPGVAGVRVMLEDGSYAVTDHDGRYHFEGVLPGTHVVQIDDATLPADRAAVDCSRQRPLRRPCLLALRRGAGRGAAQRADFHVVEAPARTEAARRTVARPQPRQRPRSGRRRARLAGRAGARHRLAVPGAGP